MREDLELLETMKAAGWEPKYSFHDKLYKREIPQDSISFRKGKLDVWRCRHGWQVAELIERYYQNHRGKYSATHVPFFPDRFSDTFGYIPDLKTVLELEEKGEL